MTNNQQNELDEIKKQIELEKAKQELDSLKNQNYNDFSSQSINPKTEWFVRQKGFIITRIVIGAIFIILFIIFSFIKNAQNVDATTIVFYIIFLIISILQIVFFVFRLICSIKILAVKYNHPHLDNDKIIWGILGIILLGDIANLVWSIKCKKVLG